MNIAAHWKIVLLFDSLCLEDRVSLYHWTVPSRSEVCRGVSEIKRWTLVEFQNLSVSYLCQTLPTSESMRCWWECQTEVTYWKILNFTNSHFFNSSTKLHFYFWELFTFLFLKRRNNDYRVIHELQDKWILLKQ